MADAVSSLAEGTPGATSMNAVARASESLNIAVSLERLAGSRANDPARLGFREELQPTYLKAKPPLLQPDDRRAGGA